MTETQEDKLTLEECIALVRKISIIHWTRSEGGRGIEETFSTHWTESVTGRIKISKMNSPEFYSIRVSYGKALLGDYISCTKGDDFNKLRSEFARINSSYTSMEILEESQERSEVLALAKEAGK